MEPRVQATLDKLQYQCEDKLDKIEHVRKQIAEREIEIDELHAHGVPYMESADTELKASQLLQQTAVHHAKIEIEDELLEVLKERYLMNLAELESLSPEAKDLMAAIASSQQELESHHNALQDQYSMARETWLMMSEESAAYEWAINTQQACDALSNEMTYCDLHNHLEKVREAKKEVERQILLRLPTYHS